MPELKRAEDDPNVPKGWFAVSPSGIESFVLCERKLWWDKIARVPRTTKLSTEKGTILHFVAEAWLKKKIPPNLSATVRVEADDGVDPAFAVGTRFAPGMKYLPTHDEIAPQGPPYRQGIELPMYVRTVSGSMQDPGFNWLYRGVGDMVASWGIGDHKTTKDFKWAKTEEVLKKDPQAMIYASSWLNDRLSADSLELRWIYYRVSGEPKAQKVSVIVDRGHVNAEMVKIDVIAKDLTRKWKALKEAKDAGGDPTDIVRSTGFNGDACSAFGGCAHRERCGLTMQNRFGAALRQSRLVHEGTKEEINQEREGKMSSLLERLRAQKAAKEAGGSVEATPAPKAPAEAPPPAAPPAATEGASPMDLIRARMGVNPPVVASSPAPHVAVPAVNSPNGGDAAGTNGEVTGSIGGLNSEIPTTETPEAPPELEAKPRRGRPPGSKNKPGPGPIPVAPEAPSVVAHAPATRTLYIGCFPRKGVEAPMSLADLFATVGPQIAAVNAVAHYRMIQYGQGPAALQVGLTEYLNADGAHITAIYAGPGQLSEDALPALEAWADVVVGAL